MVNPSLRTEYGELTQSARLRQSLSGAVWSGTALGNLAHRTGFELVVSWVAVRRQLFLPISDTIFAGCCHALRCTAPISTRGPVCSYTNPSCPCYQSLAATR
jgi:hypothetical protein